MQNNSSIHSMRGAGISYKNKHFITHTTLPFHLSALRTFSWGQRLFTVFLLLSITLGLIVAPFITLQLLVGIVSVLYFIDTVFNLILTLRSLKKSNQIYTSKKELDALVTKELPVYTILCPLYKETHVIPQFIEAIAALDYPREKLDVLLLLEEDDKESIEEIEKMHLPYYFRTIIVPHSLPKTKPKACNYGLSFAKGEYVVIYDAEDIPDPLQLKKAYIAFQKVSDDVVCLQAKLNYYNVRQNLLTRFFTAEYSLWFDITLTGLQSMNSTIPLGGTSNHFKTQILRDLEGWDPFNVTEDADLGIRLFKKGFKTAIIDSTTYEEAASTAKNWIRQRSRWIKGYMQTYLVHTRTWKMFRENGYFHSAVFQLTIGGKLLFLLLNPLLWIITLGYFTAYPIFGPTLQVIYQPPVVYLAVFSWIFGNFLYFYYYMLGCAVRDQWDLLKYVYMIPLYWAMMSYSAVVALYQLFVKPHYWEKTIHGFHLGAGLIPQAARFPQVSYGIVEPVIRPLYAPVYTRFKFQRPSAKHYQYKNTRQQKTGIWDFVLSIFSDKHSFANMLLVSFLLTFDIIVAKLLLPVDKAQLYFLLSVTTKTGVIVAQGIAFLVNNFLSKKKKGFDKLYDRIFAVFLIQWLLFVIFGIEARITVPAILGFGYSLLIPYSGWYLLAAMCFAVGNVLSSYYVKKKQYAMTAVSFLIFSLFAPLSLFFHAEIQQMVNILSYLGTLNVMALILIHSNKELRVQLENNTNSFLSIFKRNRVTVGQKNKLNILIFNWRDTKHIFAGGAEVYIHELAKRWVRDGNQVTLFCGNDNKNPATETIDGIEIYRRGGTYTVYLFAILYYFFKFRGQYDVIIDAENGIPFFTPLFTRRPVTLLIHHVHQEVFRAYLRFPLKQIAAFLEAKVMPLVYRNKRVITVSESSKAEIQKIGFTKEAMIDVVHNGVSQIVPVQTSKTVHPSFIYLGRLQEYKHIDVAIKAFASYVKNFPSATLSIVGFGEAETTLRKLVAKLHLENQVTFFGYVSEEQKTLLLAQSWAMLQPSQLEGWGITVIEANRVGTPVIASNVNGLKDSVVHGRTGILAEAKNVQQFTDAMQAITDNPLYRTMLSHNAYFWAQNFDWDSSATDFYNVFMKQLITPSVKSAYTPAI